MMFDKTFTEALAKYKQNSGFGTPISVHMSLLNESSGRAVVVKLASDSPSASVSALDVLIKDFFSPPSRTVTLGLKSWI